jgi:glycosyltransferase involved in cell wall biosynthesis
MSGNSVTVHVASLNTRAATELCLRTMRLRAGYPFDLIVGDSGSTDGSVGMLEDFAGRGWLTVQHANRTHAGWLDAWRSQAASRYLVFADSDMDFRHDGWLRDLVARARTTGAALVALEIRPPTKNMREPVSGRLVRMMPAPTTWLFLVDSVQLADLNASFAFRAVETDTVPEGCIVYDTAAALLEELQASGRAAVGMSASYRARVKHYGSMTWMPIEGEAGRRKRRNLRVIDRRLRAIRVLEHPGHPLGHVVARAALTPSLETGLEFWARVRWRAGRALRVYRDTPTFAKDFNSREH